jgi:hypothetical protein
MPSGPDSQFIVDDAADVDRKPCAVIIDADGVAVTAGPEFSVVDVDRIMFRQDQAAALSLIPAPTTANRIFGPPWHAASVRGAVPGVSNRPQARIRWCGR